MRITAILQVIAVTGNLLSWNGTYNEAKALSLKITGHAPTTNCDDCKVKMLNNLRELVNLPPLHREVAPTEYQRRLATCKGCPVFKSKTQSCGTLGKDALFPRTVTLNDGTQVKPCGCFLPLKAWIHQAKCPANKW